MICGCLRETVCFPFADVRHDFDNGARIHFPDGQSPDGHYKIRAVEHAGSVS
jgi:hypothetical protein